MTGPSVQLMSPTQPVTGTSRHLTVQWVKDSAGLTLPGSQSKVSETSANFTTQFNHYRRLDIDYLPLIITAAALYFLFQDADGDDDDQGGGMMIPAYNPTS